MAGDRPLLAIDQGTTSSRAIVFDRRGRPVGRAQRELPQSYPAPGRVEHDPLRILEDVRTTCVAALDDAGLEASDLVAAGITNQRETTVLWDRGTGRPVYPAIVWQDRRTADLCRRLRDDGAEELVRRKTGLLLDPYFSATKIAWLLEHLDGARAAAAHGDLAFGTIDTWLLWHLTGGDVHATDVTNASRTLLFDIHEERWDDELLELFGVPRSLLPEVRDSAGHFGEIDAAVLGDAVPIAGVAGDQQAATLGQAAFAPGMVKATYGTGAFLLLNTGHDAVASENRLLTTPAWRIDGETTYALEGSVFSVGSAVQWLRDGLGLFDDAADTERMAARAGDTDDLYLVPAFTGLGAPHWDADARGALLGLTRGTGADEIVRVTLEAVAYQTRDLMEAMAADATSAPRGLRVDGGLSRNGWAMRFLSDLLDVSVERPTVTETTALGAAYLAGLAAGVYADLGEIAGLWRRDRVWEPSMESDRRQRLYGGWRLAVGRVLSADREV